MKRQYLSAIAVYMHSGLGTVGSNEKIKEIQRTWVCFELLGEYVQKWLARKFPQLCLEGGVTPCTLHFKGSAEYLGNRGLLYNLESMSRLAKVQHIWQTVKLVC